MIAKGSMSLAEIGRQLRLLYARASTGLTACSVTSRRSASLRAVRSRMTANYQSAAGPAPG